MCGIAQLSYGRHRALANGIRPYGVSSEVVIAGADVKTSEHSVNRAEGSSNPASGTRAAIVQHTIGQLRQREPRRLNWQVLQDFQLEFAQTFHGYRSRSTVVIPFPQLRHSRRRMSFPPGARRV